MKPTLIRLATAALVGAGLFFSNPGPAGAWLAVDGDRCLLVAQAGTAAAGRSPAAIEDLRRWRAKLEKEKTDLEKEAAALARDRAELQDEQQRIGQGDMPAALVARFIEFNRRTNDYDRRRLDFHNQSEAYVRAQNDLKARGIRETVTYQGPDTPPAPLPEAATPAPPVSESATPGPAAPETATPAPAPAAADIDASEEGLERRRKALDVEYAELSAEQQDIDAQRRAATTPEAAQQVNDRAARFNARLKEYEQRRQAFNEAATRYNDNLRQQAAPAAKP